MSNRRPEEDWTRGEGGHDPSLVEQIKMLAEAMSGTSVTELEMEEGGIEIRLRRQPLPAPNVNVGQTPIAVPRPNVAMPIAPPSEAAEVSLAVMAPLTGVFYASPSPSSPNFVQPGDVVQPGQVVCIVEAMKVFNEIKTEIGGTVVAIPPKSGQLVKKGDPLVRLKPL